MPPTPIRSAELFADTLLPLGADLRQREVPCVP